MVETEKLVIRMLHVYQLTTKRIRFQLVLLKLYVPRIICYAYPLVVLQSGRAPPDIGNRISNFKCEITH